MKEDTRIVNAGRHPEENFGIVNPPVYRASTVTFPSVEVLESFDKNPFDGVFYGRHGTPTTFALEDAVAELEGGDRGIAMASGLAAIAVSLMAFLKSGDHALVADSVYGPTRRFCDQVLKRYGVETTYYDPAIGAGIEALVKANTKVVFVESPGSLTFEIQDIPAIAKAAHAKGAVVILDNSWATPLYFKPFAHGVDVSIQAATKYIVGHADAMLGVITTKEPHYTTIRQTTANIGACSAPEECFLALRGLRTLRVRLERHHATAMKLCEWLKGQNEVARILYPALPEDPGHALWKRDFTGAPGLFSFVLKGTPKKAVVAMLDGMKLFAMGYSWGGYESLILPFYPESLRTATQWQGGPCLRIHAGLEDAEDLIRDLDEGFKRMRAA
ncbi:MAG: cystathionine beta-lyase [Alphaproteobacteria bacterium]